MSTTLASKETFERIAALILSRSTADDTLVGLSDSHSATLRFANNQVVQNVAARTPSLSVRVAIGKRVGRATTNQLGRASILSTLRRAEEIAGLAPDDPEFLPSLPPQEYDSAMRFVDATANARPGHIAQRVRPVVRACDERGLSGAGIMTNQSTVTGLAASSDLFAFDRSTSATFSLTATAPDSTGWVMTRHRDINGLRQGERTDSAVDKALRSKNPRRIEPGHYTVILEPSATAGLLGPLLWSLGAKSYHKGNSALAGKLGSAISDVRLTLKSDPSNPRLLGSRFNGDGMPQRPQTWVENGVLKTLHYDRFTALEHGVEANPGPDAVTMSIGGPTARGVQELIEQTERGILITNFWYIRYVNASDLTITGMTRDGTFLIEDGKVVCGLRNFRFHDSPLRAFQQVDAATQPMESVTLERGKMLLPAVKLPEFNLSSVTEF